MTAMWRLRTTFTLLALALLCSPGWALECYNCPTSTTCDKKMTCVSPQDACLKIDVAGSSIRQCYELSKCSSPLISAAFGISNFKSSCCQDNLCNSGRTSLPVTPLILSLVAAILFICYP